jgi:hypothetical protein
VLGRAGGGGADGREEDSADGREVDEADGREAVAVDDCKEGVDDCKEGVDDCKEGVDDCKEGGVGGRGARRMRWGIGVCDEWRSAFCAWGLG